MKDERTDRSKIDRLIINSPFEEPQRHWKFSPEIGTYDLVDGRRPAGYLRASESSKTFDSPGVFISLPLVNKVRPRVKAWRDAAYPGTTSVTKRLLEHWHDADQREGRQFFFCQLEAIETLIWLAEAPEAERQGIDIPTDGGEFRRLCSKMATGSGKTNVMGLLIAWQVLNKVAYPQDPRFSKHIFIVAPGLTVKNRLGVLTNSGRGSAYDEFNIIPHGEIDRFRQGKVVVHNWHVLAPMAPDQLPAVMRRQMGAESDEAYCRRVLGDLASHENILVINDEAHHAWRVPPKLTAKEFEKEDVEEATVWIQGLDRIHKARRVQACYDFTATPFAPTGKKAGEETLFPWVISDFGLNDAIESGLVKTPRLVIRDDALPSTANYRPKLYHIYPHVRDDLNRKAEPHEPLPDLVLNAYLLLGADWEETRKEWQRAEFPTPPVMISVGNRTETAARIYHTFTKGKIPIKDLCDPEHVLHIDSKVLKEAEEKEVEEEPTPAPESESNEAVEEGNGALNRDQLESLLRRKVDTVGKPGKPGEQVRNVISVAMLTEGWDARTVTHIMGLRAFTSQLLCEQVIGRGLRRTSYEINPTTKLFDPEYVNVFGVPFSFLPHEGGEGTPPPPPTPKIPVEPVREKRQFELKWPNVLRVEHEFRPTLSLNLSKVKSLSIKGEELRTEAELAPLLDSTVGETPTAKIKLEEFARRNRLQTFMFRAAQDVYERMEPSWKGSKEYLLGQVIKLTEDVIRAGKISIDNVVLNENDLRLRILLALSMNRIVQHIWEAIRFENVERLEPIFDREHPIRSTADMPTWYTSKPTHLAQRSHINRVVLDSTLESTHAQVLDRDPHVVAWAKNDHLGFEIHYVYQGTTHKYRPDFLVRLTNGTMLVLETKGTTRDRDETKWAFTDEWIQAVNTHGAFVKWARDTCYLPKELTGILKKHAQAT